MRLFLLLALSLHLAAVEYGAATSAALVEKIKTAAQTKDKELFISCSCWDRIPQTVQTRLKATEPGFMSSNLEGIEILEGHENPYSGFAGFKYNVDYIGVIKIKYSGSEAAKMPYGSHKGRRQHQGIFSPSGFLYEDRRPLRSRLRKGCQESLGIVTGLQGRRRSLYRLFRSYHNIGQVMGFSASGLLRTDT